MSDRPKYESVNECTEEISKLMTLHILGVWQNAHKFMSQLAHATTLDMTSTYSRVLVA